MALTRPVSEQLRFQSSKTGEHVLDTYLEAAEIGNRTLPDLLEDVFDPAAAGRLRTNLFQFRLSNGVLEHRAGDHADQTSGWVPVTNFFKDRGAFSSAASYAQLDLVTFSDVYYLETSATPVSYASSAAFIASPTVRPFFNVNTVKTYRDEAATSATNAANSASAAATSKTGADTAKTGAEAASALASDWAEKATAPAGAGTKSAKTHAADAAASASAAGTSASNASTSASNASTSATNAATSATNASNSAAAAAASYDSFDDRYLGPKASAPTLDNDGAALLEGALYWHTGNKRLYIWNGTAWIVANFDSAAVGALAGVTSLTGTAVTQSAIDTTAGRLLKVGDAGILGNPPTITDANAAPSGFSTSAQITEGQAAAYNLPVIGGAAVDARWWNLTTINHGNTRAVQEATEVFGTGIRRARTWHRVRHDATWHPWVEIHDASAVDTGSNANGEYIRLPDGTQWCWHTLTSSTAADTTWSYPAAFISGSTAAATITPLTTALSVQEPHLASLAAGSLTFHVSSGTARLAVGCRLVAVGRYK